MADQFEIDVDQLAASVRESQQHHGKYRRYDAWLFNGGTVLVLALTSAASFLEPGALGSWSWLPRAISGAAAIIIGIERSLSVGQRWRFHIEQESGYQTVLDRINFLRLMPELEKPAYVKAIWDSLKGLREREAAIPGVAVQNAAPVSSGGSQQP
jgi:hypothetical protein